VLVTKRRSALYAREALRLVSALARAWPPALVSLLLACLLVQGTAVQSHIHFTAQARVAALAGPHGQTVRALDRRGGSDPADCPLCQEAAMAGAYLLPPAIVLPAPPALPLWAGTTVLRALGVFASAHSWQSRAPPQ
jgi:hypothetical protein